MTKKIFFFLTLSLFLLSSSTFSHEDDKDGKKCKECHGGGPRDEMNVDKLKEMVDLTNDQVDSIKKIDAKYNPELKKTKEAIEPKKKELKELIDATTPDLTKIEAKLKEISALKVQKHLNLIKRKIEVDKILTPAQKEKLKEKMKEKKPKDDD